MFSSCLRVSLVALAVSVVAVCAAPATSADPPTLLDVKISISLLNIDGPETLKVTTTVANAGDKTLTLLKDPRGILDPSPEDTFTITGPADSHPSFLGAKVKYNPTYIAGLDGVRTILPPGTSVGVIHDLAAAYDFTKSGAGEYSIEPSNLLTYVDGDGNPQDFYAAVVNTAKVRLSGDLPAPRVHNKRATYDSCSPVEQSELETAAKDAQTYASDTYAYIKGISSGTARYTTWFGEYDEGRKSSVEKHFELLTGNDFSGFTYNCTCTDKDALAYVHPEEFGIIYICGPYWTAPATGLDSKAGTIIHEAARFTKNGGAEDYVYYQDDCKDLAKSDPVKAALNAGNHEYFAENISEEA